MATIRRRDVLKWLGGGLVAGPLSTAFAKEPFPISIYDEGRIEYKFHRREVKFQTTEPPGTIIVDTRKRWLFFVLPGGKAIRYGVGIGNGFSLWSGEAIIARKAKWPTWTPTAEMFERSERFRKWQNGMPGGPDNPLGARAMYLLNDGKDNHYRIHGTPLPETVGQMGTSGCFRMLNKDVIDLYDRVDIGTRVIVLSRDWQPAKVKSN